MRSKHGEQKENMHMKLEPTQSRTLKKAIQQLQPIQIWDWLFRSCEHNGKILLDEGLITIEDIEESFSKGISKKLSIRLPAWCILQCLLCSAKTDGSGLLISDGMELTNFNWPREKVLEWLFGPLLIMKEQIKGLDLKENEESCLRKMIMTNKNERPEYWNYEEFQSDNKVRRAQIQAIFRRLQGMMVSLSRMPTFRRRFSNLMKALYVYAIETCKLSSNQINSKTRSKIDKIIEEKKKQNRNLERASQSLPPPDHDGFV